MLSTLEPTIFHINYWDQAFSWKNSLKFWNSPLSRNKSGPSRLLNVAAYWKNINTDACAKKLSQILVNNTDKGGRWICVRTYVSYCLKKSMKNKGRLGKTWHSFSLNFLFLMFGNWFYDFNWVTPWPLWPSKKELKLCRYIMNFCH